MEVTLLHRGIVYVGASYEDIELARTGKRPENDVFTVDRFGQRHLFGAAGRRGLVYGDAAEANAAAIVEQLVNEPDNPATREL